MTKWGSIGFDIGGDGRPLGDPIASFSGKRGLHAPISGGGVTIGAVPLGARFSMASTNKEFPLTAINAAVISSGPTYYMVNKTGRPINRLFVGQSGRKVSGFANSAKDPLVTNGGSGYTTATAAVSGQSTVFQPIITAGVITALVMKDGQTTLPAGTYPVTISGDGAGATATYVVDGLGEASMRYDRTVAAQLEYPLGTSLQQMTFDGQTSKLISKDVLAVKGDEFVLATAIQPGDKFGVKLSETDMTMPTLVASVASGDVSALAISNGGDNLRENSYSITFTGGGGTGAVWKIYCYQGKAVLSEKTTAGTGYSTAPAVVTNYNLVRQTIVTPQLGDKGTSGAVVGSSTPTGTPPFIAGYPDIAVPAVVLDSDSIGMGDNGGDVSGDALGHFGWPSRGLGKAGVGVLKQGMPGEYASGFMAGHAGRDALLDLLPGIKNAVVLYGTNDIIRLDALATVQASMIAGWVVRRARVTRVFTATLLPKTTSTQWADTASQTPSSGFAVGGVRSLVNAWIRDGAPIQTSVAVAVGTTGGNVYRIGDGNHPLYAYFDIADQVESGRDTGLWMPLAWPGVVVNKGCTTDGTHPTDVYHEVINGRIGSVSGGGGTGYGTAPTMAFSDMGIPILTPVLTSNTLTGATVVEDGGYDFDFPPVITVLPLNGTGTAGLATGILTNKRLTGITGITGSTGLTAGCLLSVAGMLPPQGHTTISGGVVIPVLDWPGSGLAKAPTVTLSGGGGTGAVVTATLRKAIDASLLQVG